MPESIPTPDQTGKSQAMAKTPSDAYDDRCMAVPGFSSLWMDILKLGSEYGPDWGIAKYALGPVRLLNEARRVGWRPGDISALRNGALSVAQQAAEAELQRKREHYAKAKRAAVGVPDWWRDRNKPAVPPGPAEIPVDDPPPFD